MNSPPMASHLLEHVLEDAGVELHVGVAERGVVQHHLGLYPIVTLQYSSTTLYQVSYHIRSLFL